MFKVCIKCRKELELNSVNFHTRKDSKDGYRNDCKFCFSEKCKINYLKNKDHRTEYGIKYREKNKAAINARMKKYNAENKERISEKHFANKEHNNQISRNYYYKNREKVLESSRNWKRENKERNYEIKKAWYKTEKGKNYSNIRQNKRKTKLKSLKNDLTTRDWEACLKYFGNTCAYCGEDKKKLEMDHFIPVTKNGGTTKSNMVPACRSCNSSKNNKLFDDWYKTREYYSPEREEYILNYLGVGEAEHVI